VGVVVVADGVVVVGAGVLDVGVVVVGVLVVVLPVVPPLLPVEVPPVVVPPVVPPVVGAGLLTVTEAPVPTPGVSTFSTVVLFKSGTDKAWLHESLWPSGHFGPTATVPDPAATELRLRVAMGPLYVLAAAPAREETTRVTSPLATEFSKAQLKGEFVSASEPPLNRLVG
jgi:hypothetical protein